MLCSLCGHKNPPDNRFCGMCGMPLENAVFKPAAGTPAISPRPAEPEGDEAEFKAEPGEVASTVPALWDRLPPTPQQAEEKAAVPQSASVREKSEQRGRVQSIGAEEVPQDEVRERLSSMVESRSRRNESSAGGSSTSILGLDLGDTRGRRSESDYASSSISGPSFLGLGGGPSSTDYLLDDEEEGHGRAWLVLLVIILLAVLVGLQWRTEVRNRASLVAAVVKARLQNASQMGKRDAATAPEAKTAPAETSSATPPASTPSESAKTTGEDVNPFDDAEPEQPASGGASGDTHSAKPSKENDTARSADASKTDAKAKADDSSKTDTKAKADEPSKPDGKARAEKSSAEKESASVAEKQATEEEESTPAGKHATQVRPAAATREVAPEPAVDDSMLMKAQKYLQGQGVPRSCERGMIYLRQAVRQPSARARSQMGALYATGTCVPQNRVEAYRWFTSALDLDPRNPWLARERDMLYTQMTSSERRTVNP